MEYYNVLASLFIIVSSIFGCDTFEVDFLNDETFLAELDELARNHHGDEDHHEMVKRYVEEPLPNLLDFNGTIEVEHPIWNTSLHHIHNPSPTYIINLYQSLTTGFNLVHPSDRETTAIRESDTVRSFGAKVAVQNVSADGSSAQFLASFKLSSFLEHPEDLHLAELRVMIRPDRREDIVEIGVHHFAPAPCKADAKFFECMIKKMISTRQLFDRHYDNYDGREVFDVTKVLRAWLTENAEWDTSFELNTKHKLSDGVNATDMEINFGSDIFSEVVLVCFSKASSPTRTATIHLDAGASVKVRQRRATDRLEEKRRKKKEKEQRKREREEQERARQEKLERERQREKQRNEQRQMEKGPCRRVSMHVDFTEVGWQNWIIYPKQFNSYRCAGRCDGYLDQHDNPTNHAILQGMVRIRDRHRAPEPCCVPTKLSPLSILYFEKGTIVMKNHEDMLVEECGCR